MSYETVHVHFTYKLTILLMLEVLFGLKPGRLGKNCYVIATHLASLTKQGVWRSRGKNIFLKFISRCLGWHVLTGVPGISREILASVPLCHSLCTACYCFVMSAKIQRDPTSFRPFFFCPCKCNLQPFLSRFYTILFICGPRSFLSQTVACAFCCHRGAGLFALARLYYFFS